MKTKINALLIASITALLLSCVTSPEAQMLKEIGAFTEALNMVAVISEEEDINTHIENLNKRNRAYRFLTVSRLSEIGPDAKEAIGPLTKIAKKDRESKIRIAAIEALKNIGGSSVNPTLKEISLGDKNPEVRLAAKENLER